MKNYFAAIICATKIEENAIRYFFKLKEKHFKNDEQTYYQTKIISNGKERNILFAKTDEYGMTASATLSMKLIFHAKPKYLIMPGIAAGINQDTQEIGDIILANQVWNCTNGKYYTSQNSNLKDKFKFESRPIIINSDKSLIPTLKKAINSSRNEAIIHIGPLASGTAIVANKHILKTTIEEKLPATQGLDMESYGVIYAANHAPNPKPRPIIAKGICDFGDENKNDEYQQYAAYTSCEFIKYLLESELED